MAPAVLVTDIVLVLTGATGPIIDSSQLSPIVLNQLPLNYSDTPPWFVQPDQTTPHIQDVLKRKCRRCFNNGIIIFDNFTGVKKNTKVL